MICDGQKWEYQIFNLCMKNLQDFLFRKQKAQEEKKDSESFATKSVSGTVRSLASLKSAASSAYDNSFEDMAY